MPREDEGAGVTVHDGFQPPVAAVSWRRRYFVEIVMLVLAGGQGVGWVAAEPPDEPAGNTSAAVIAEGPVEIGSPRPTRNDAATSVAAAANLATAADAAFEFRLGHWNVKKLGHGTSTDYELVAEIIDEHFDVLGLVEVMQKAKGHPGYDELLEQLGDDWAGLIVDTPRPNDPSNGSAEWPAILYRTSVVSPCEGTTELTYAEDNDGTEPASVPDIFSRDPAFACLVAGEGDGPSMDFVLGVYHARWADGDYAEIAAEVDHVDEVFDQMAAAVAGEKDLILVGDFNLVPERLHAVVDAVDRTTGEGSTLNSSGERTENLYDHVLVESPVDTQELVGDAEVLDVRGRASDAKTFYKTVSDHLPVVLRVRVTGDDDDD